MSPDLEPYMMLLRAYTEHRLSEEEFSLIYVMMFKRDPAMREQAVFDLLPGVFSAADGYSADAHPSKPFEVGAATKEAAAEGYSAEEEREIAERLKSLGYVE